MHGLLWLQQKYFYYLFILMRFISLDVWNKQGIEIKFIQSQIGVS